jgi:hypothetical protein
MTDETAPEREHSRAFRILTTPLGDLMQGRVTGPRERGPRAPRPLRGYRAAVLDAGLPSSVAQLVLDVTRRTRLRRREKVDVARELVAHFRDGLDSGATGDTLTGVFGNPVQAARLIRRAKKRNRSLLWHAWVNTWKTISAVLLLCIVLYGVLAARYWMGRPSIKRNIAAELNAATLATPESERAWPVYRRAYLALPVMPEAIMNSGSWPAIEPTDADWPVYTAYVEALQPSIQLVREAAALPHMGFILTDSYDDPEMTAHALVIRGQLPTDGGLPAPSAAPSENPWAINLVLFYLGNMRGFARDLAADARVALFQGEGDRFVADYVALNRLAGHSSEHPFLISKLVGLAVDAVAFDLIAKALDEMPSIFTDADLVALAHRVGSRQAEIDIGIERGFFEDTVQRFYTDNGHGDGRLVRTTLLQNPWNIEWNAQLRSSPIAPVVSAISAGRREVTNEWNRLMGIARDEATSPMWTWTSMPGQREMDRMTASKWYNLRYFPISMLVPAVGRVAEASNKSAMRRDAMAAALVLELWKRTRGEYPASLEEMTPEYLPAVPVDRFDGRPLKYRLHDGRATIYSSGRDRDDDGGRPPATASGYTQSWASPETVSNDLADPVRNPLTDGDWILWPPVKYDKDGNLIPRP